MVAIQKYAGALWCRDVLERLSDYLDGELSETLRSQIEDHLAECSWCEKFGNEFQAMIGALRTTLAEPAPVAGHLAHEIRQKLNEKENKQ